MHANCKVIGRHEDLKSGEKSIVNKLRIFTEGFLLIERDSDSLTMNKSKRGRNMRGIDAIAGSPMSMVRCTSGKGKLAPIKSNEHRTKNVEY